MSEEPVGGLAAQPQLLSLLAELAISYERYDHAPVNTCEEAERAVPNVDAVQTKNLFLRDKRGRDTSSSSRGASGRWTSKPFVNSAAPITSASRRPSAWRNTSAWSRVR